MKQPDATCPCTHAIYRSSLAVYRSILVLASLANTRAGQSERRVPPAPIRTPELSSRLSGQKANSIHIAAWHNWARTPPPNIVRFPNAFSCLIYPSLAIAPFWFGGIETWLGAVRRTTLNLTVIAIFLGANSHILSTGIFSQQCICVQLGYFCHFLP